MRNSSKKTRTGCPEKRAPEWNGWFIMNNLMSMDDLGYLETLRGIHMDFQSCALSLSTEIGTEADKNEDYQKDKRG